MIADLFREDYEASSIADRSRQPGARSMEFWQHWGATHWDRWRALPRSTRWGLGLGLALLTLLLILWTSTHSREDDEPLFAGRPFSPPELLRAEAAFARKNLTGHRVAQNRIYIPHGRMPEYVTALESAQALPHDIADDLATDVQKSTIFTPQEALKVSLITAKQNFLAKIIREMPDIEKAWVVLDSRAAKRFGQEDQFTASVSVQATGGQPLSSARCEKIRALVAGSVAGLTPAQVCVVDLSEPAAVVSVPPGNPQAPVSADPRVTYPAPVVPDHVSQDPILQRLQEREAHYRTQIEQALRFVPGVQVTVHVDLGPSAGSALDSDAGEPAIRAMTSSRLDSEDASRPPAAAQTDDPQIRPNRPGRILGALPLPESHSESSEVLRPATHRAEPNRLTSLSATAAILVPRAYFVEQWRAHQTRDDRLRLPDESELRVAMGPEIHRIQTLAAVLLPQPSAQPLNSLVRVAMFDPPPASSASSTDVAGPWETWLVAHPAELGLAGIVVVFLGIWTMILIQRRAPADLITGPKNRRDSDDTARETARGTTSPGHGNVAQSTLRGPHVALLQEHLNQIVQQDPAAAAQVLRGWLGPSQ